jgi:hypothetical protein
MWLYVFMIFFPFFRHLLVTHDVSELSLSHIGWIIGDMRYLLGFLILALPFKLYLILFIYRNFVGSNNRVRKISVVGCALIVIGGLIPLREETTLFCFMHVFLAAVGAIALILTILAALFFHASKSKQKMVFFLLCGLYTAAILVAFAFLRTAALFQLLVTLHLMLAMLIFITVSVKRSFNAFKAYKF